MNEQEKPTSEDITKINEHIDALLGYAFHQTVEQTVEPPPGAKSST